MPRITKTAPGQLQELIKDLTAESIDPSLPIVKSERSRISLATMTNEAIALLCQFLPLPETSSARLHYFPGWTSRRGGQQFCVLGSQRSRSHLLSGLEKLLDICSTFSFAKSLDDHERASSLLEYLSDCDRNFHAATKQGPALTGLTEQFACRLRDLFDNTTAWFLQQVSYSSAASHTDYVSLVAAHCFTGIKKCHAILKDSPTILLNED